MKAFQFIGRRIEVLQSSCKTLHGLTGKIIDETAATFTIQCNDGSSKVIMKNQVTFRLLASSLLPKAGTDTIIKGSNVLQRPEERIKRIK